MKSKRTQLNKRKKEKRKKERKKERKFANEELESF